METEGEKLDESFQAYLKRQHSEKSQLNDEISRIWQNYSIRKSILDQNVINRKLTPTMTVCPMQQIQTKDGTFANETNQQFHSVLLDDLESSNNDQQFNNPYREIRPEKLISRSGIEESSLEVFQIHTESIVQPVILYSEDPGRVKREERGTEDGQLNEANFLRQKRRLSKFFAPEQSQNGSVSADEVNLAQVNQLAESLPEILSNKSSLAVLDAAEVSPKDSTLKSSVVSPLEVLSNHSRAGGQLEKEEQWLRSMNESKGSNDKSQVPALTTNLKPPARPSEFNATQNSSDGSDKLNISIGARTPSPDDFWD